MTEVVPVGGLTELDAIARAESPRTSAHRRLYPLEPVTIQKAFRAWHFIDWTGNRAALEDELRPDLVDPWAVFPPPAFWQGPRDEEEEPRAPVWPVRCEHHRVEHDPLGPHPAEYAWCRNETYKLEWFAEREARRRFKVLLERNHSPTVAQTEPVMRLAHKAWDPPPKLTERRPWQTAPWRRTRPAWSRPALGRRMSNRQRQRQKQLRQWLEDNLLRHHVLRCPVCLRLLAPGTSIDRFLACADCVQAWEHAARPWGDGYEWFKTSRRVRRHPEMHVRTSVVDKTWCSHATAIVHAAWLQENSGRDVTRPANMSRSGGLNYTVVSKRWDNRSVGRKQQRKRQADRLLATPLTLDAWLTAGRSSAKWHLSISCSAS